MVNTYSLVVAIAVFLWIGGTRTSSDGPTEGLPEGTRSLCDDVLTRALGDESPVVRVQAAESLTSLDRPEPVLEAFRPYVEVTQVGPDCLTRWARIAVLPHS